MNRRIAALGDVVDPERDEVHVDGELPDADRVRVTEPRTTILLHEPAGYPVSRSRPRHGRTVYDLPPQELHHLMCRAVGYPVIALRRISFAGINRARLPKWRWPRLARRDGQFVRRRTESGDGSGH